MQRTARSPKARIHRGCTTTAAKQNKRRQKTQPAQHKRTQRTRTKKYIDELVAEYRSRKQALLTSARQAYQQSLSADDKFSYAYRGLGLAAYAAGESKTASESLTYYLTHAKDVTDRPYINNILRGLARQ